MNGNILPMGTVNHGKAILRGMAAKTLKGKLKAQVRMWAIRVYICSLGSLVIFAGLCGGDVMTQVIKI